VSAEPSVTFAALKMLGALALVLLFVWGLYFFLKRFSVKRSGQGEASLIRILETRSLGVKKQLAVLDVMGDLFLLGISGDSLTLLSRIRSRLDPGDLKTEKHGLSYSGFGDYLARLGTGVKEDSPRKE
jgi:flagellar biosynthetic protein FliO